MIQQKERTPSIPLTGGGVNSQNINPQALAITGVPADCVFYNDLHREGIFIIR